MTKTKHKKEIDNPGMKKDVGRPNSEFVSREEFNALQVRLNRLSNIVFTHMLDSEPQNSGSEHEAMLSSEHSST